mmetsp:Transcript_33325/g.79032  ORF Transcript_33325/g.79032 Transcript_33325/m.79032 type:complete len:361 (-) Transcript_33325:36-1118(-)
MKYVKLGSSELSVSEVCLGTMTFGEQCCEEDAFKIMDAAFEKGVNFFDVAEMYPVPPSPETCGLSEKIVGNWLETRGIREKIILATKVTGPGPARGWASQFRGETRDPKAPPPRIDRENIRAAIEGSLRRLKTSYIDLYQIHWPDRYVPAFGRRIFDKNQIRDYTSFEEQMRAMSELIKEGKIRAWGVSNETTFGICKFCEIAAQLDLPPPVSIQNDFSLGDRRFEAELAEACEHYNVGLLVYGALAGGMFSSKYLEGPPPEEARHARYPDFQPRYYCRQNRAAAERYSAIAKEAGLSLAQLAYAFCKSRFFVASTIIGANNTAQLEENIRTFEEVDLGEATLAKIDEVHRDAHDPQVFA